jgi:hypothetical protein
MAADDRLIEIMSELLLEVQHLRQDSNIRFERLEEQQKKTNLGLGELRLSVMRLADQLEKLVDIDQRVRVLEDIVLRKAS